MSTLGDFVEYLKFLEGTKDDGLDGAVHIKHPKKRRGLDGAVHIKNPKKRRKCPVCKHNLYLYYLNETEMFLMCENDFCEFPFGYEPLQVVYDESQLVDNPPRCTVDFYEYPVGGPNPGGVLPVLHAVADALFSLPSFATDNDPKNQQPQFCQCNKVSSSVDEKKVQATRFDKGVQSSSLYNEAQSARSDEVSSSVDKKKVQPARLDKAQSVRFDEVSSSVDEKELQPARLDKESQVEKETNKETLVNIKHNLPVNNASEVMDEDDNVNTEMINKVKRLKNLKTWEKMSRLVLLTDEEREFLDNINKAGMRYE